MRRFCLLLLVAFLAVPAAAAWEFPSIEGWTPAGDVRTFDSDGLWEHINGAAELYIDYGFRLLRFNDLKAGDLTVTVNVYDMGSPLNAFGMYSTERGDEKTRLAVGGEAVLFPPYQGLMVKGAFYVKIEAYEGEITAKKGRDLLEALAQRLEGTAGPPKELERLPAEGKVPGSEGYARESFLGIRELKNCLFAEYGDGGERPFKVFVVLPESDSEARAFRETIEEKWSRVKHEGEVFAREIPYKGKVGLIFLEKGIVGISNSTSDAELLGRLEAAVAE